MGAELCRERLAQVRDRIAKAGASPSSVRVVAVTKGFGSEAVEAAVGAGLLDLGENYAQELLSKAVDSPSRRPLALPRRAPAQQARPPGPARPPLARARQRRGSPCPRAQAAGGRRAGASPYHRCRRERWPAGDVAGDSGRHEPRHGASADEVPALVESARAAGLDVRGLMAVGRAHAARERGPAELPRCCAPCERRSGLAKCRWA